MKVVKVMIAAAEELHQEMLEFTSLIEHLNKVLKPRGIELKRVKWNSEEEKGDFQDKLKDCEFCLKLYWTNLSHNSEKELKLAYDRLKQGDNPKNLYVFFKEPAIDISDALKDFKANFVTNYGHFFCKFENVDTMNLHFILQFESMQNNLSAEIVTIKEGNIQVDGESFADLDNVPFIALNKEYQKRKEALEDLNNKLTDVRVRLKQNPNNDDIEDELYIIRRQREKVVEEIEKLQNYLFNIALCFAQKKEEHYSDRLSMARDLFEKGDVSEADKILDFGLLKLESREQLRMFEQNKRNLEIKIEEFLSKAKIVMANITINIEERYKIACNAYLESIDIAERLGIADVLADIKYEYAGFLQAFNRTRLSLYKFEEALSLYRDLSHHKDPTILSKEANILHHIGQLSSDLQDYNKAELNIKDALSIYKNLSVNGKRNFDCEIAHTLSDLARLYMSMDKPEEFKIANDEALTLWQELSKIDYEKYHPEVARTLVRGLQYTPLSEETKDRFWAAEDECVRAIEHWKIENKMNVYDSNTRYSIGLLKHTINNTIRRDAIPLAKERCNKYIRIIENLAKDFPDAYYPDLAFAYEKLAEIDEKLEIYSEAELYLNKALELWRKMTAISPEAFAKRLPVTYKRLALIHINLMKLDDAESELKENVTIWRKLYQYDTRLNKDGYIKSLRDLSAFYELIKKEKADFPEYKELISLSTGE